MIDYYEHYNTIIICLYISILICILITITDIITHIIIYIILNLSIIHYSNYKRFIINSSIN